MQTTVLKSIEQTCNQPGFKMWRAEIGDGPHEIEVTLLITPDGQRVPGGVLVFYGDDGEFQERRRANATEIRGAFLALNKAGLNPI